MKPNDSNAHFKCSGIKQQTLISLPSRVDKTWRQNERNYKTKKLSYRHEMFWLKPKEKASNWLFYLRSKFCVSSWETKKNKFFSPLFIHRRSVNFPHLIHSEASTREGQTKIVIKSFLLSQSKTEKAKNSQFLKNFSIRIKWRYYRLCDFSERCCSKILSYKTACFRSTAWILHEEKHAFGFPFRRDYMLKLHIHPHRSSFARDFPFALARDTSRPKKSGKFENSLFFKSRCSVSG